MLATINRIVFEMLLLLRWWQLSKKTEEVKFINKNLEVFDYQGFSEQLNTGLFNWLNQEKEQILNSFSIRKPVEIKTIHKNEEITLECIYIKYSVFVFKLKRENKTIAVLKLDLDPAPFKEAQYYEWIPDAPNIVHCFYCEYKRKFLMTKRKNKRIYGSNHQSIIFLEYLNVEVFDGYCIDKNVLNIKRLNKLSNDVLNGLSHLHRNGYIHGDLKVDNVMGTNINISKNENDSYDNEEGIVYKLIDLGLLVSVNPLTGIGAADFVRYALFHRPPELITDDDVTFYTISTKADIYAFGAMVYVLSIGEYPYNAHYDDFSNWVMNGFRNDYERDDSDQKRFDPRFYKLPPSLKELILKCLSRNPEDRPSADELLSSDPFITMSRQDLIST